MANGWDEVDCHVTHLPLFRDWEKLVSQPKLLTNRSAFYVAFGAA